MKRKKRADRALGRCLAVCAVAVLGASASGQNFGIAKELANQAARKVEEHGEESERDVIDAGADELTVEQIVDRTNYVAYYQGKDGRAKVKMTVTDRGGQERTKGMVILRRDSDDLEAADAGTEAFKRADATFTGRQKFYVYFQSPPDDAKTTFLVHKYLDRDDDRWLYLPNLDLVKRIAATDKRTSFVGSHFFYEDVSGRNINDDRHELRETTDTYYILRNTPKKPGTVEFAYYDMYILRENFLPAYIMYYDKDGTKYRTYSVVRWDRDPKFGYPTVKQAKMEDQRIGGSTVLEYTDVTYNIGLPESLFTERFLKRTPYTYLDLR